MRKSFLKRVLVLMLIVNTGMLGMPRLALSAPIGIQTLIQLEERQARIDRVQATLAQDDVRAALVELGVNPVDAEQRVAALTDQELRLLESEMENLPAGGVLAVLGVVLVVLIVLELTGVTNVFTKL